MIDWNEVFERFSIIAESEGDEKALQMIRKQYGAKWVEWLSKYLWGAKMNIRFNNFKIFYCKDCKKTFKVTPEEYKRDKEVYNEKYNPAYIHEEGMITILDPMFELNGHKHWIYRDDEDYSEYLQAEKRKVR